MNHEIIIHSGSHYIELPGLPSIREEQYNQTKKPPCLTIPKSHNDISYDFSKSYENISYNYFCGKFQLALIEHIGRPMTLSPQHTINPGDHYLNLALHQCTCFNEVIISISKLIEFTKSYPGINWLVGSSWLASVDDGKLIKRFGFHPTNIHVPRRIRHNSKEGGLSKDTLKTHYFKTVKNAKVKFMFASRDEFLSKSMYNTLI
jgi:hypothetical protein